jgi:hypothetical protein
MPFRKIAPNKYVSPSGRTFNQKQIALYYAKGGRFPGNPGMAETLPRPERSPTIPYRPLKRSY